MPDTENPDDVDDIYCPGGPARSGHSVVSRENFVGSNPTRGAI